ncbi:PLDc N-terminal domain-containing protein [Marinoscillum sp.]|uniref:PLDc N-terminal domain-containing protein n=1 Tax=Marinoscillum sp. TaxID=2024838 RepID=UPI003BA8C41E
MPGESGIFVILLFLVLPGIIWLWALIDALRNEFNGSNKLVWILLILFLPFLGALLYLVIGRNQRIKT